MAELLRRKNPKSSKAKRPRLTARLSTKALVATPCRFSPLFEPSRIPGRLRLIPLLLVLLLPAMLMNTV